MPKQSSGEQFFFGLCRSRWLNVLLIIVAANSIFFIFLFNRLFDSSKEYDTSRKQYVTIDGESGNLRKENDISENGYDFDGKYSFQPGVDFDYASYTISFWMFPMRSGSSRTMHHTLFTSLVSPCIEASCGGIELYFNEEGSSVCILWKENYATNTHCASGKVPMNEWTHITLILHSDFNFNSRVSQEGSLYINGVKSLTVPVVRSLSIDDILIGNGPDMNTGFSGHIRSFMGFTRALKDDEIQSLVKEALIIPSSLFSNAPLVLFYRGKSKEKVPKKKEHANMDESVESLAKSIEKKWAPLNLPDHCEAVPPPEVPKIYGELEEYIGKLHRTSEEILAKGEFQFFVPQGLSEDYHNLTETRAIHVRNAFCFAWANYRILAWGKDEIQPISGSSNQNWGGMSVTLIDTLDTLSLMGLTEELKKAREVVKDVSFDVNHSGSVFETNIRLVGGLEAAYDLTKDKMYLEKAVDIAKRLLPAFNTESGYPKNMVNYKTGESKFASWTSSSSVLAELGSFSIEFYYLSKHTWHSEFRKRIDKIYDSVSKAKKMDGLLRSMMDVRTGESKSGTYSFGGCADSYYEYLLKTWILTGKKDTRLQKLYNEAIDGMVHHLLAESASGLLYLTESRSGQDKGQSMGHLTCFAGGMLALGVLHDVNPAMRQRDLKIAKRLAYSCYRMYTSTKTGVGGEDMIMIGKNPQVSGNGRYYILRPEAVETMYYMNKITGDPIYREWGWVMWRNIQKACQTQYGYAHLRDVNDPGSVTDRAESFFFAETAKYLYLLFEDEQLVDLKTQVFNTEAHPVHVF